MAKGVPNKGNCYSKNGKHENGHPRFFFPKGLVIKYGGLRIVNDEQGGCKALRGL